MHHGWVFPNHSLACATIPGPALLPLQHLLQCNHAYPTQALDWWVGELVGGPNLFDAERLLADYCLVRRNRLSSVAAVEAALLTCKVGCVGCRAAGKGGGGGRL
jgi:hypothetical protein